MSLGIGGDRVENVLIPTDFQDGGHENSMKESNKLISISISLTSCRERNNHNVLIPTNTKFIKSNDIS